MAKTGPKVRESRRLGIPLTPKAARIMEKRGYPPGQHGRTRPRGGLRQSDYKEQLLEKQRLRGQYNIQERQMRNYFIKASSRAGNTADNLIQELECRLDAMVLRAGLAPTIYAARQIVTHGHVLVNGQRVSFPSYQVGVGDVVAVKEKSRQLPIVQEALDMAAPPAYVELNKNEISARLAYLPKRDEVPVICDISRVIEFYSR